MKLNGAQAILQALLQEGTDIIFGYPGGVILPLYDELFKLQDTLRHILVRHEQGAVHAAEGYARTCQKPGVCMVSSGPGATNLITGIADAMMDCVPIICITGQVPNQMIGTDAFQETDIIGISLPITKWSYQIKNAQDIPNALAKAFYIAQTGKPGPVLLDITKDALLGELEFTYEKYTAKNQSNHTQTFTSKLLKAANLINEAQKPYILAGHGVLLANAEQALIQLAQKANIPVACTLLGLSAIPSRHPLSVGMLGMHGHYGPNILTNQADLILAVGMRFDDRVTGNLETYAKKAKIIHIDICAAELNKNVKADIALKADAKEALQMLIPYIKPNRHPDWLAQFAKCDDIEYDTIVANELQSVDGEIKMAQVIAQLSQTSSNKIIVTDVGQHQMILARYFKFIDPNSHITSGGLGTMGFALPAAIGARHAAKNKEVIAIIGDGGFQMTMQELGVIKQEKLPIKIIILNNNHLGMIWQLQDLYYQHRFSFAALDNPDFIMIANSYGIKGRRICKAAELNAALDEMLALDEPYLLEIVVKKQENVFPMIPAGAGIADIRLS